MFSPKCHLELSIFQPDCLEKRRFGQEIYFLYWFENPCIMCASLHTSRLFQYFGGMAFLLSLLFARCPLCTYRSLYDMALKLYCFGGIEAFPEIFLKEQRNLFWGRNLTVVGSLCSYDSYSINCDNHFWGRKEAECRNICAECPVALAPRQWSLIMWMGSGWWRQQREQKQENSWVDIKTF